jgi:hypothetical protein
MKNTYINTILNILLYMKYLTTIVNIGKKFMEMSKDLSKLKPIPLGRWRMENCNNKMNNKIDLSNEDHCGPCGKYALDKIELKNDKKRNVHLEKSK